MPSETGPVIIRMRGVLSGRPVFRGTRVQAEIVFESLADGASLDEILESFPTLDRADVKAALRQACEKLIESAPLQEPTLHARHA